MTNIASFTREQLSAAFAQFDNRSQDFLARWRVLEERFASNQARAAISLGVASFFSLRIPVTQRLGAFFMGEVLVHTVRLIVALASLVLYGIASLCYLRQNPILNRWCKDSLAEVKFSGGKIGYGLFVVVYPQVATIDKYYSLRLPID